MDERRRETPPAPRSGERVGTKLRRIAAKARVEKGFKFTSLYHMMNEEQLRECFSELEKERAAGIDRVTKEGYGRNLGSNIGGLVERLHQMAYRPQPVRRVYIPKPGSNKQRPLGIPSLEDKLVQKALVRILEAIYEEDFIEGSYGFRPGRGCHDALRRLTQAVEQEGTNYVVEADIKGYFDNVEHDWMMKFLEHRIGDKRVLRMIVRFLRAGVIEEGKMRASEEGTPQGGSISPLLANIYLHYVLDLWFERGYRKSCRGKARLIRYADDCAPRRRGKEAVRSPGRACFTRDEGRSLGVGLQGQAPNHLLLLRSRALVVSETGKGAARLCQVRVRKTNASEPLMTCRKRRDDAKTGTSR